MRTLLTVAALFIAGLPALAQDATPIAMVIFDGNSLTQSRGGVPAFPDLIDLSRMGIGGSAIPSANVGASGTTTDELDALAGLSIDIANPPRFGGLNVVVFWEGANSLYRGATVDQAYADLLAYATKRRAKGYTVIMLTLLPRSDAGYPATYEASRRVLNARMKAAGTALCDVLVDVASDRQMGYAGAELDERFYLPDRVHLNLAGAQTIAGYVAEALAKLQAD